MSTGKRKTKRYLEGVDDSLEVMTKYLYEYFSRDPRAKREEVENIIKTAREYTLKDLKIN